jgi:CDP-diacylglycerol pyrophosphatase
VTNGVTSVATSAIDALKTSPVLLLIVLLNMAFAGSAGWYLASTENKRNEAVRLILDRCIPVYQPPHDRQPYPGPKD